MGDEPRKFCVVKGETRVTGEKPPNSYIEALLHLVKSYVGTGIYAMGASLKFSGSIMGPLFCIFIAFIGLHCQHILVKASVKIAMKEPQGENIFPTFDETVKYAFLDSPYKWLQSHARCMAIITNVFLAIGQAGFCVAYFVFIARHFIEITEQYGFNPDYRVMLAVVFIPIWLSTFLGSLRLLTPINLISNVLIWIGIGIIFYYTTTDMKDLTKLPMFNFADLPLFFGIIIFSFQNIGLVLPLRSEVKNTNHYVSFFGILNVGMVIVVVLYLIVGIMSYWKYGTDIKGSVFLNLPRDEKLAQATRGIISIAVLFSFALQFYIMVEIIYPGIYERLGPFKYPYMALVLFRFIFVTIIYLFANISENIGTVISLVGSSAGSYTCIILPALLEIALGGYTKCVLAKDILLIIFGVFGALTGTGVAIKDIVNSYITTANNTAAPIAEEIS